MEASQSDANPNPNTNNNVNRNSIISSTPLWPTIDGPLGLTEEESLNYSRNFYKFGYALLPWLWAVNCFYFWPALRHPGSFPRIRRYVVGSAIGFTVFTAVLCSWAFTFAIGGEDLFGPVWEKLVMYNLSDRLGLTVFVMEQFGDSSSNGGKGCQRGHWRPAEDEKLCQIVDQHGPKNWNFIAQHLERRSGKSCRLRWYNQLAPNINKNPFTEEEEERLLKAHLIKGNRWASIAKLFPGRTDNAVKNHYHVIMARIKREPFDYLSKYSQKRVASNFDDRHYFSLENNDKIGNNSILSGHSRGSNIAYHDHSSSSSLWAKDEFHHQGIQPHHPSSSNSGFVAPKIHHVLKSDTKFMNFGYGDYENEELIKKSKFDDHSDVLKKFGMAASLQERGDGSNKDSVAFIDFLGIGIS